MRITGTLIANQHGQFLTLDGKTWADFQTGAGVIWEGTRPNSVRLARKVALSQSGSQVFILTGSQRERVMPNGDVIPN